MKKILNSDGFSNFFASILAILVGVLVGFIIMLIADPSVALTGFIQLLSNGLSSTRAIGRIVNYAAPLIMTGLSIGFAFKTGLFNIGASGQFIVGAYAALYVALECTFFGPFTWFFAILAAGVAGGLWALIPGLLKAYRNVNEVISSIMMNYIGMSFVNIMIKNTIYDTMKNQTLPVDPAYDIPSFGLDKIIANSSANGGILIAIIIAIIMYIILNKTTFGYELKACGFNKEAARYAGISEKKSIVLSMVIAGALAGIGGGLSYLAGTGKYIEVKDVLAPEGFNGIPVALLAISNPIGTIFSALFFSYLLVGGTSLQTLGYSSQIVDMITAVIIYFSAFSLLFKLLLPKLLNKKKNQEVSK